MALRGWSPDARLSLLPAARARESSRTASRGRRRSASRIGLGGGPSGDQEDGQEADFVRTTGLAQPVRSMIRPVAERLRDPFE